MKLSAVFFFKITIQAKPCQTYQENKREDSKYKSTNESRDVSADTTEIQKILRGSCKQLCVNISDGLEDMIKLLGTYNMRNLNYEEIEI